MGVTIRCWVPNCDVFPWDPKPGKNQGAYSAFAGNEAPGQRPTLFRIKCPNGHYNWIQWSEELHTEHLKEDPNYEYKGKR